MTFEQVKKDVDNIIDKYWNDTDECYNNYFYDEEENIFNVKSDLENYFISNNVDYLIEEKYGFNLSGFSEDFMAIAYKVNDWHGYSKLGLKTVVFKYF